MTEKPGHLVHSTGEVLCREVPFHILTSCRSTFAVSPTIALPLNSLKILEDMVRVELF